MGEEGAGQNLKMGESRQYSGGGGGLRKTGGELGTLCQLYF